MARDRNIPRAFRAEVVVMPLDDVADPQGQAIESALETLRPGEGEPIKASEIRVGKVFRLTVHAADRAAAEAALERLADRVLANPNVERFDCRIVDEDA